MRKVIGILGIVALLAAFFSIPIPATARQVEVSVDAPAEVEAGANFTAQVDISEVTNFDSGQFDISFDDTVINLTSVTNGLINDTEVPVVQYNPDIPRVVVNIPGTAGASGSGCLAEIHFRIVGSAGDATDINLVNGMLSDNEANEISATWTGASVTVARAVAPSLSAAVSPSSRNTTVGTETQFTVTVENTGTGEATDVSVSASSRADITFTRPESQDIPAGESADFTVGATPNEEMADAPIDFHITCDKETIARANATLTAQSVPEPVVRYALDVGVSPEGSGEVSLSPDQPADGYEAGTEVTLRAEAKEGYLFGSWSGDASGSEAEATVTMDSDKSVTARFAAVQVSPPEVTTVSPGDDATDVAVDAAISIGFSKGIDRSSAEEAFSIEPPVKGSITWADSTMTFRPDEKLEYGTTYELTVSTAAMDKEGNALGEAVSWSFTTKSQKAQPSGGFPFWGWIIIGIAVLVLLIYLLVKRKRRRVLKGIRRL